jgi:hypothetical protein
MGLFSFASILSASHLLVVEPNQWIGQDVAVVDLPPTSQHLIMFSSASAIRREERRTPGWRCEGRHVSLKLWWILWSLTQSKTEFCSDLFNSQNHFFWLVYYRGADKSLARPTSRCILYVWDCNCEGGCICENCTCVIDYPDWGFSVLFPQL